MKHYAKAFLFGIISMNIWCFSVFIHFGKSTQLLLFVVRSKVMLQ